MGDGAESTATFAFLRIIEGAKMALTSNEPMSGKSIAKLLLSFSACFLATTLGGVVAFDRGILSPRALGIFLAALCLVSFVFLVIAFRRLATQRAAQGSEPRNDVPFNSPRDKRLPQIRMCKAGIAVLAVCLVGGIVKGANIHPVPLLPMLVGITMNLLTIWVLVITLRNLQKSLN